MPVYFLIILDYHQKHQRLSNKVPNQETTAVNQTKNEISILQPGYEEKSRKISNFLHVSAKNYVLL